MNRRQIIRSAAFFMAASAALPFASQAFGAGLRRKVRIGTEGLYAPFSWRTSDGRLTGFDVEVAREAAARLDVDLEFVAAPWDSLVAALDAGRVDAVFNQVVENESRRAKYALTDVYLEEHGVVIVRESETDLPERFEALQGRRIAGVPSANWTVLAQQSGAVILPVKEGAQAFSLVATGRADAAVNAERAFEAFRRKQPRAKLKAAARSLAAERVVGLFRKQDADLAEQFSRVIREMRADGTLARLEAQHLAVE